MPVRVIKSCFNFVLSVFFITYAFLPLSEASLTPIEISEGKREASSSGSWFNSLTKYREHLVEEYGTEFAFLVNYTQQIIIKSIRDQGKIRGVGYLNLEIEQRLWPGTATFIELESDKGRGVDQFISTFSGCNTNSGEDIDFYIPEFYIEQNLFTERISLSVGKLDLSDWFDGNLVAESGDTQFLSCALINSLTIPFPAKGLGARIEFKPYEWIYFESGASTARASSTKTGLSDGFNSVFFVNEIGLSPKIGSLKGNYRFIFHMNHEKLERIGGEGERSEDFGYGISFDQEIAKGITLFLRYGHADERVRDIKHFWSFGGQIIEPIPGRKFDCLGVGVARSIMGKDYREASEEEAARSETIYEVYYSYNLNSFLILTPNLQIVTNPNADKAAETALVCGLRFLLSF
jgi:carbohydrate-selective porin OprB